MHADTAKLTKMLYSAAACTLGHITCKWHASAYRADHGSKTAVPASCQTRFVYFAASPADAGPSQRKSCNMRLSQSRPAPCQYMYMSSSTQQPCGGDTKGSRLCSITRFALDGTSLCVKYTASHKSLCQHMPCNLQNYNVLPDSTAKCACACERAPVVTLLKHGTSHETLLHTQAKY